MNGAEKTEVADIARGVVLELMPELLRQLTPILEKIADRINALSESDDKIADHLATLTASAKDRIEGHNEHVEAIEQLMRGQSETAKFVRGLADQYGQIFKALSDRIGALETGEEPPPATLAN